MIPRGLLPDGPDGAYAFIAGGFAACPALAQDVDIWCSIDLTGSYDPFLAVWQARDRILDHVRMFCVEQQAQFVEHDGADTERGSWDSPRGRLTSTFEGYHMPLPIRRVGAVTIPGHTLPYHIIVVGGDVDEVLSSFDISTHMIALTSWGVIRGEQWTPIWEPPVVLTQKYTTPERLEKIRARYAGSYK